MSSVSERLARKPAGYKSDIKPIWCPGCGDYHVLMSFTRAFAELPAPERIVVVSGIGCSSRILAYTSCYGFHGVYGRSPALAAGLKVTRPDLTVERRRRRLLDRGNHFLHACRRNIDMTYVVMDNRIYGMTKGQPSPTTEPEFDTALSPGGTGLRPFHPLVIALASGANFVARCFSGEPNETAAVLVEAIRHPGFSFVEILSPCVTFRPDGRPSMTFKRSTLRYGETPEPITPYQKAAQVWDERIGSARVQAHNWRLMALARLWAQGLDGPGRPLFLLDGLEEIAGDDDAHAEICDLIARLPQGVDWIVSSRATGLTRPLAEGRRYEIAPPDDLGVSGLVANWFRTSSLRDAVQQDADARQRGDALVKEILAQPRLLSMARNPFLLSALCLLRELAPDGHVLPSTRAGVYDELVHQVARHAQAHYGSRNILDTEAQRSLARFCLWTYDQASETPFQIFEIGHWQLFQEEEGVAHRWSATSTPSSIGWRSTISTARNNTHGAVEREVLYPWHPWFGRVIRIHGVIRRGSGDVWRCSLDAAGERIEVPSWMFDRAVCSGIGMTASPHLDAASLMALKNLLADCGASSDPLSHRPDSDARSHTCDPNGGDGHGDPQGGPEATSTTRSATRSVRGVGCRASRRDADLAASAGRRTGGSDKAHRATPDRSRARRSQGTSDGRTQ